MLHETIRNDFFLRKKVDDRHVTRNNVNKICVFALQVFEAEKKKLGRKPSAHLFR